MRTTYTRRSRSKLLAAGVTVAGVASLAFAVRAARKRTAARRAVCADGAPIEVCEARHAENVNRIATQLRHHQGTRPLSLLKRTPSHQVPKARDKKYTDPKVDVSDLDRILAIDPIARTCTAEPGVAFADVVAATLKQGLVPLVVPEFKTITLGGAVSGCSIESMSFQHGGFHDSCLAYEVITAKGEVITCTREDENRLVFEMMHGSFGTLGILSKLTFRLTPAKRYVRIDYEHYDRLEDFRAAIWRHFDTHDVDFMDGMIHGATEYVLSLGRFVDEAPYTHRYDWGPIYYRSTRTRTEDYLETTHYFFRYDQGVTNVHPKSRVARFLFGRLWGSTQILRAAEKLHWLIPAENPTMTLDVFIPFSKVPAFIEWYGKVFAHYPVWVVPYRRVHDYEWLSDAFWRNVHDPLFLDLAIYGLAPRKGTNFHRLMEEKLLELGGVKTLIAHNYYSEDEFWQTWNRENYETVKARVDPQNLFRNLYDKTCRAALGLE